MCDCILQTQHRLLHASYGVEHATHHIVVCGGHVCTLARSRSQQNFTRLVDTCLSDSIWSRVLSSYMLDFTFGEIFFFFYQNFPNICWEANSEFWSFALSCCLKCSHLNDLKAQNGSDFESGQSLLQVIWFYVSNN